MSKSVSGFLEKLGELSENKIAIYVPSIKKAVDTSPLTLKQQKDLISSALDGVKGAINFNKTLNEIIIKNTELKNLKIYDKLPFVISLRKESLGNKIKSDDEVVDLDEVVKNFKSVPFNLKEEKVVSLKTLKVHLRIPTLTEENVVLAKGEQDVVITDESTQKGVGTLYMLEIIKYIDKLTMGEDEVDMSQIKINDRIKLVEQLPLAMYNEIAKFIEAINVYLRDVLTVGDTVVSIDAEFFDTSDVE
tara:strand:- start:1168 stop:1908 length:741 start_codon:yes stop_codon:yes gene_type:complete